MRQALYRPFLCFLLQFLQIVLSFKLPSPVLCLKNDLRFKILVRNGKSKGVEVVDEASKYVDEDQVLNLRQVV